MKLLDAALRLAVAEGADVFGGNFARWCAVNNIPRSTAYRHKKRVEEEGAWTTRSRRPTSCPHHTPLDVEIEVIRLRLGLEHENGADSIAYHLHEVAARQRWQDHGWTIPSRATINKILTRYGLVTAQPKKRPKSSYRRFAYARPRDCYQIDATEVRLATGEKAVVFEVLDDCTRTLVATIADTAETSHGAITAITTAFADYGIPALVLSDNGSAFTSRHRHGGTSRFTRVVKAAGARQIHSSPYHPQTCGKVERHHRTFKQWLTGRPTPATLPELQTLCDTYQRFYNTERRHSAWNMPPQQAWTSAPALGGPEHLPTQQDATIYLPAVVSTGVISVGSLYLSVGRDLAGSTVTVLRDGDHLTVYRPDGHVLGHLHLDQSKRYQGKLRPAA
jgi:transposase InsO family protein